MINIEVCERAGDWRIVDGEKKHTFHAQLKGSPGIWDCGNSAYEAIGSLISHHKDVFNIAVDFFHYHKMRNLFQQK